MTRPPVERPFFADLHCDALYEHAQGRRDIAARSDAGHLDIPRMKEGGVSAQVFAVWTNPEKYAAGERAKFVHSALDAFDALCARCADVAPARTAREMDKIRGAGRVAAILGIEGAHALEGDLANLEAFHGRGVRVLTITWNNANEFADSCVEDRGRGLTDAGRRAVSLANSLGITPDLSHASPGAFFDTLEASSAPVICSHSACRALCDHPRNLTDEQLGALGRAGGVAGIAFLPAFLRPEPQPTSLEDVLDHIEHAAEVAGIDAVALGSDFDGFGAGPAGLEDVTKVPDLAAGLRRRGFSEADTRKVMGENFARLWRGLP